MIRTTITALFLVALSTTASGQAPTRGQGRVVEPVAAISGVVIDGTSGEPVENATVTAEASDKSVVLQTRQFTDAKGRFVFVNLKGGIDYTLTANASGYFSGAVSRDTGPSDQRTAIPVKESEWVRDVRVTVWKPGAISGRVVDEAGESMVGVYVRALSRAMIAGREQFVTGPLVLTDDRGVYRIPGLLAGRYIVEVPSVQTPPATTPSGAATPGTYSGINGRYPWAPPAGADGRPRGYPITFYPGARSAAEATSVDVSLAQERSGVDITLEPATLFKVSGKILGQTDALTLRMIPAGLESLGNGGEAGAAPIAKDGAFEFVGVPAGAYVIDVRRRVPEFAQAMTTSTRRLPAPSWTNSWSLFNTAIQAAPPGISLNEQQFGSNQNASNAQAKMAIAVNADIADLVVTLRNGATMDGTIELDADASKPDARPTVTQNSLTLDPASGQADLGSPIASIQQNAFHFDTLRSGDYFLRARNLTGWVIKSVMWNGQDFTKKPFDAASAPAFTGVSLVVTNRVAAITGMVKEKSAAVILFPADQTQWSSFGFSPPQIRSAFTAPDGSFRFETLPAGDYFVLAVDPANRMAWLDPEFFARMTRFASRVDVGWGDTQSVNLSIAAVRK